MTAKSKLTVETPVHKQWSIAQKRAWQARHHGAFTEIAAIAGVSVTQVRRCFWTDQKPGPTDEVIARYILDKELEQLSGNAA